MFKHLFPLLLFAAPALAVQTSHWTQTNEADFKKGTFHNVVATNLGDLKLSRAVKSLLEEDARVSAVYCMAEAPDGTIYAGTGPHGVLLQISGDKVSTLATFEENCSISTVLVDPLGRVLVGTCGEKGHIYRVDPKAPRTQAKPKELFAADGVQYIWSLALTPDGLLYAGTGPNGQLFEIKPDGTSSVLLDSDDANLLTVLSDGKELLYIGTDPSGLVYRVNRKSKDIFVLFDAEAEVSCLALDAKGNLYAGTAEGTEKEGLAEEAAAKEKVGRPEGTGGVPLPSTPPKSPKPPPIPEPNPGEPPPIPKSAPQVRGDAPPSPLYSGERAGVRGQLREGSKLEVRGSSDLRTSKLQPARHPGVPPLTLTLSPECSGQGTGGRHVSFALLTRGSDEPASLPGPVKKPDATPAAPATAPAVTPAQPAEAQQPRAEGNAIYRIDPEGFVTEVFRQPVLVFSMIERDGTLLVGTGSDGLIYQVNIAAGETVVLAKAEPKQVTSMLATRDGHILLGLANVGGIVSMSSGYATDGTYVSPVLDATQISRFGKIHLDGSLPAGTALTVAMRSGNVQDPTRTGWSKWSEEAPATAYFPVTSPPARFLQYRLTLTSKEGEDSPVVSNVDTAYQMPNLPPAVKTVKVSPAGKLPEILLDPNIAGLPTAPPSHRIQAITWEAEDPNGDALQYSIYFRSGSRAPWILLKNKLAETHFDWDTRTAADGRYEVKVVASDAGANPPGQGKTGSRVSDLVIVDNTPPVIGDLKWALKGRAVHIQARLVDRTTTVASCDYSVDSTTDWQAVLPSDNIFDSPEETVSFTIAGLTPGAHQVTLRAADAKGNQAYETIPVTVEAPAAAKHN